MIVLDSTIRQVKRNRDFGMIEARVTLLAKTRPGQPPHLISVRTHAARRGTAPLRDRLIADAIRIASHLSRQSVESRQGVAA